MFEGVNGDVGELARSLVMYLLPLLLVLASNSPVGVHAAQEFQVYRMQQYDLPSAGGGGGHLGSRANSFSMEARTITSKPSFISRRCVLVRLDEFTLERYRTLVANYAGAIVVIIPRGEFTSSQRQLVLSLEATLLNEEVKIPLFFIRESPDILNYYAYIDADKSSQADSSAAQVLVDSVLSDGFQFVVNANQPKQLAPSDYQALNLQGKLNGGVATDQFGDASKKKIPTILIVAHYDAFGLATSLSYGCDSNGSGMVALLELSRILSYLYADSKTIPALNLVFLLTAHGKFNYYGLKKWIDEQAFRNEMAGRIDLDDVEFAICLDSLGRSESSDGKQPSVYMHYSKPPKEGQASYEFLKSFEKVANRTANFRFETVHKKINLASEQLAWEHEKFSLNKIPAFTLSHYGSHRGAERSTMTDTINTVDAKVLAQNIKALAQTIIQYMYKNEDIPENLLKGSGDLEVSDEFVASWLAQACSVPRSPSLLNKNHPLVNNLYAHFSHYLHESVKLPIKVLPKEAEFVFYNEEQATLIIYNVKPAPFDLFLALLITGYIGLVYLFVLNFGNIFVFLNRSLTTIKNSNNGKTTKVN